MAGDFVDEEYIAENHALMMYAPFLSSSADENNNIDID